jgi:hypothetical protein
MRNSEPSNTSTSPAQEGWGAAHSRRRGGTGTASTQPQPTQAWTQLRTTRDNSDAYLSWWRRECARPRSSSETCSPVGLASGSRSALAGCRTREVQHSTQASTCIRRSRGTLWWWGTWPAAWLMAAPWLQLQRGSSAVAHAKQWHNRAGEDGSSDTMMAHENHRRQRAHAPSCAHTFPPPGGRAGRTQRR